MLEESRKSQGNIKSFRIPVVFSLFWFNLYYFKLQKFAQKNKKKRFNVPRLEMISLYGQFSKDSS